MTTPDNATPEAAEASETTTSPTVSKEDTTAPSEQKKSEEVKDETPQSPSVGSARKVTGKRGRSALAKGPSRVELPEQVFVEVINLLSDEKLPTEQQIVALEILSRLDISITTLQKTQAGLTLRQLKKSSTNTQVQQLCQEQISEYRNYVEDKLGKAQPAAKKTN